MKSMLSNFAQLDGLPAALVDDLTVSSIFYDAPIGGLVLSYDGTVTGATYIAAELLDVPHERLLECRFQDFMVNPAEGEALFAFPPQQNTNIISAELSLKRGDEGSFQALVESRHMNSITRKTNYLFLTFADVTTPRQLNVHLREITERFHQVTDGIQDVFYIYELPQYRAIYVSSAYSLIWGLPVEELYQDPRAFRQAIHPEDRARVESVLDSDLPQRELEYRIVRPDGDTRWILDRNFTVQDQNGRRLIGLAQDITPQKKAQIAEREQRIMTEALYATAIALTSTLNLDEVLDLILENVGRVVPHDTALVLLIEEGLLQVKRMQGYRKAKERKQLESWHISIQESALLAAVLSSGEPLVVLDEQIGDWLPAKCAMLQASLVAPIHLNNEIIGFISLCSHQNKSFTNRHAEQLKAFAAQAAVAIHNARTHHQAGEIATLKERQRLARELHDAVTQSIFASSIIAQALPLMLEKRPEKVREQLAHLEQLNRNALSEMRVLLMELRPEHLLKDNLTTNLQQLISTMRRRKSTEIDLHLDDNAPVPPNVQVAFYRIAQEALNNILKHSNATKVSIHLSSLANRVTMVVRDNGQGFSLRQTPKGFGLQSISERAKSIGAKVKIHARKSEGVQISVQWQRRG